LVSVWKRIPANPEPLNFTGVFGFVSIILYGEQNGLLESIRNDDYAYRIYDEKNIKRLQQIIILRKLQIPVKQIRLILDKPDAATAIELFKSNILELENEISALVTIKSALEIFVTKIEEIAAVKLSLDVLTDDTVLELADSLSLSQKNVNEDIRYQGGNGNPLKYLGNGSFVAA